MGTYFLDTSAIIKRYIFEPGQAWVLSLCNPAQVHDLYLSQAALVEVVAAVCRRAREKSISMPERDRLITVFRQDSRESYNIWSVTTDLYNAAGDLCRSHRLRAYDAIQLACVLALRQYTLVNRAPGPRDCRLKIRIPIREYRKAGIKKQYDRAKGATRDGLRTDFAGI